MLLYFTPMGAVHMKVWYYMCRDRGYAVISFSVDKRAASVRPVSMRKSLTSEITSEFSSFLENVEEETSLDSLVLLCWASTWVLTATPDIVEIKMKHIQKLIIPGDMPVEELLEIIRFFWVCNCSWEYDGGYGHDKAVGVDERDVKSTHQVLNQLWESIVLLVILSLWVRPFTLRCSGV